MGVCVFQFATWFLPILLVSPTIAEENIVVHLDLSPLRVNSPTLDPPQDTEIIIRDHSAVNDSQVYCTDSTFPSDIYCDLGSSKGSGSTEVQFHITDVFLKFPHPNGPSIECFVGFGESEDGPTSRLIYKSFVCYNASDSEAEFEWLGFLEWKIKQGQVAAIPEAKLPEDLKVEDITLMEIEEVGPAHRALKCKSRYKRSGRGGGVKPSVAFEVDTLACISAPTPDQSESPDSQIE